MGRPLKLCHNLEPQLRGETQRSNSIPVAMQVFFMLGFLATGAFQWEIGDRSSMSQPIISRMMPAELAAVKSISRQYITFPYNNVQQIVIKREFYEIAGFPNVIGAIDCTHVHPCHHP